MDTLTILKTRSIPSIDLVVEVIASPVDYWAIVRNEASVITYAWISFRSELPSVYSEDMVYLQSRWKRPAQDLIVMHESIEVEEKDVRIDYLLPGEIKDPFLVGVFIKEVLVAVFLRSPEEGYLTASKNVLGPDSLSYEGLMMTSQHMLLKYRSIDSLGDEWLSRQEKISEEIGRSGRNANLHNFLFFTERWMPAWSFFTLLYVAFFKIRFITYIPYLLGTLLTVELFSRFFLKKVRVSNYQFVFFTSLAIALLPFSFFKEDATTALVGGYFLAGLVIAFVLSGGLQMAMSYLRKRQVRLSSRLSDQIHTITQVPYALFLRPTSANRLVERTIQDQTDSIGVLGNKVDGYSVSVLEFLDRVLSNFQALTVVTDEKNPLDVFQFSHRFFNAYKLDRSNTKVLFGRDENWMELVQLLADHCHTIIITPSLTQGVMEEVQMIRARNWQYKTLILLPGDGGEDIRLKEEWEGIRAHYGRLGLSLPELQSKPLLYSPEDDFSIRRSIQLDLEDVERNRMLTKLKLELFYLSLPLRKGSLPLDRVLKMPELRGLLASKKTGKELLQNNS